MIETLTRCSGKHVQGEEEEFVVSALLSSDAAAAGRRCCDQSTYSVDVIEIRFFCI